MVIGIFGECCTGKSFLAMALAKRVTAEIFTGKDYLKLAKNELEARAKFSEKLRLSGNSVILFVTTEREHLALLPALALRVLTTAPLDVIKARFAQRTGGKLSPAIEAMLEKNHGMFDREPHDIRVDVENLTVVSDEIIRRIRG